MEIFEDCNALFQSIILYNCNGGRQIFYESKSILEDHRGDEIVNEVVVVHGEEFVKDELVVVHGEEFHDKEELVVVNDANYSEKSSVHEDDEMDMDIDESLSLSCNSEPSHMVEPEVENKREEEEIDPVYVKYGERMKWFNLESAVLGNCYFIREDFRTYGFLSTIYEQNVQKKAYKKLRK
ncbi:hypothetical protein BVC80_1753g11 [Macleaya cordata]|uniref:Uncharacterized protein n=1 Tax=Macleaya cordata TaxID=56857 RepID=A0A200QH88_MACCD|nr:hypothetical protein BVC80_1753g11 [Macleaya cordata]